MKIVVAKTAGFCYGVRRAVSMCEKAALEHPVCVTLGPIIHNRHVIRKLEEKGVRVVTDITEIPEGAAVVIRSHGAAKGVLDELANLNVTVIDATCPDVKRIHDIVSSESLAGRVPVIIGERRHPEVVAISGWCGNHEVFETAGELSEWLKSGENARKPISVVFQTTNTLKVYNSCDEILKKECTNYKTFDTICGATFQRQHEAVELSKIADVMVVVGDYDSANSLRLADICREFCSKVIIAQSADDIKLADISAADVVGVTAGASAPTWIIKEVTQKMSQEVLLEETNVEKDALEKVPTEQEAQAPGVLPEDEKNAASPEVCELQAAEPELESIKEGETTAADAEPSLPEVAPDEPSTQLAPAESEPARDESVQTGTEESGAEAASDSAEDQDTSQETFEEMLVKSIKTLHTGEKVSGVVTSITATEVSVELGTKQSGYIPITEFTDDGNIEIDDAVKIGDTIEAFVMRVNDVEGMVMLSKKRLDSIKNWDIIEAAKDNKAVVEGVVTEENKGGIVVSVKGIRVFVPASQIGISKNSPTSGMLKKTVKLRIKEVNASRRRVVGSIRDVQADERREKADKVWADIETGKRYNGVVKSMTSYGVFVDIGGVDGMIHVSEISWTRIKQPSEVMSIGDEVSVYVLSFDKETRKISLGYKKAEDNPWNKFKSTYAVGDIVNVKIVKMMPFGAFAEVCPGVDGLIHISQIADRRIGLPSEVLSDGQLVDVKITEIDNDRKKVSLSIRALIAPSSQPLSDEEAAQAQIADNTPVIVYDTDAPPPAEPEDDEGADEPESAVEAEAVPAVAESVPDAEAETVAEPEEGDAG